MSILKKNIHKKKLYGGGIDDATHVADAAIGETTSWLKMFLLIIYIVFKYPIKYTILLSLLSVMIYLFAKCFQYMCRAFSKFADFLNKMLNPGELNLVIFTLSVNPFHIFEAFIDLIIGLLYAAIGVLFFIGLGLTTLPFNFVFTI